MKWFLVLFAVVAASVVEVRGAAWTLSPDGPEKISEHVNIIYT